MLYEPYGAQPEGFGGEDWMARRHPPLLFPNVTRWEQLFDQATTDKTQAPPPYIVYGVEAYTPTERQRGDPQIGPFMTLDLRKIGGHSYGHAWVRCVDPLSRALTHFMLMIRGDRITFNLVAWNENQAVVCAHYGQILGSHWIAIIDPYSIPEEVLRDTAVPARDGGGIPAPQGA
jgi:hypothetical protein